MTRRRTLLQTLSVAALSSLGGCSALGQSGQSLEVDMRMVRLVNLTGRQLTVHLAVSPTAESEASQQSRPLYDGSLGPQDESDAGAGEVVLRPTDLDEPLEYDYTFSVADGGDTRVDGSSLRAIADRDPFDSESRCLDLEFTVFDAEDELSWDVDIWGRCADAPGESAASTES